MTADTCLFMAIDQGGHASRTSLYRADGTQVTNSSIPIRTYRSTSDHIEHDPEEIVASIQTTIAEAVYGDAYFPIVAAGLATQRSSVVCWNTKTGAALSPVLSWQDRRGAGWLEHLTGHAGEIRQRTGLPLSAHYGASKLRWCWDHLPAVQSAWKHGYLAWGPLASFLTYRLTEERTLATDPANASRTLLWNLENGDWDSSLAKLFGVPTQALPPCVATRHAWGHFKIGQQRIPLTVVTGDQSAALFAAGERAIGDIIINLGTGAFLQKGLFRRPPSSRLLTSLAYQDGSRKIYALEGTVNGAGSALAWTASRLNLEQSEIILRLPDWLRKHNQPPIFLNGVAGLGTPYLQPLFASRFIGNGSAAEKCVAVCESIVFLLQVNLEEIACTVGPTSRIIIYGGLSRLDGMCQRLANLSGLPLFRPTDHEGTVRGLIELLADTPWSQPEGLTGTKFGPQSDPALASRYQAWRKEVETALLI